MRDPVKLAAVLAAIVVAFLTWETLLKFRTTAYTIRATAMINIITTDA